ncbi:hypothetical protein [Thermomonas sp.]|uniref:hypothetical protein n=1 Tax=Thermomonas sp. TaxID=1971895 RepID=UPI002BD980AB|nr:hypothetical protein [Thermomonas sp.]HRO63231.1 hypothetical protein [Thermomonas sp.]
MRNDLTSEKWPKMVAHSGVILSASNWKGDDLPRTVYLGIGGSRVNALAFYSPWLERALEAPLHGWTLQLVDIGTFSRIPLLLGLEDDPFVSGLDLLPEDSCPIDGTVRWVRSLVNMIKTEPLHMFVHRVLERRDVAGTFWTIPASGRDHHSHAGGLAQHSAEVADDLSQHHGLDDLELDLGIAGALLHDIGKVWSYTEDMFPNAASLAMGHELVGLSRLEPELAQLESQWPDGSFVIRSLLSGNPRVRENGSLPSSLLQRIKACDQRSCERERMRNGRKKHLRPVWTPCTWESNAHGDFCA